MNDPKVGEPLVVCGVSIPWDEEHGGWFLMVGSQRIGIERYDLHEDQYITYRYIRLNGGAWSMCSDISFSIDAMVEEFRKLTACETFMDLLLAVSPRHS